MDDIWTALLSDDEEEQDAAFERIGADPVASQIARSVMTGPTGATESGEEDDP